MDTKKVYKDFLKDFDKKALKARPSKGRVLTSVSPQYIIERLNDVCGIEGWVHDGSTKYLTTPDGKEMFVVFEGHLKLLDADKKVVAVRRADGAAVIKSAKDASDAVKSAQTESLSKCASKLGIANDVFKGLVDPPQAAPTVNTQGNAGRDF